MRFLTKVELHQGKPWNGTSGNMSERQPQSSTRKLVLVDAYQLHDICTAWRRDAQHSLSKASMQQTAYLDLLLQSVGLGLPGAQLPHHMPGQRRHRSLPPPLGLILVFCPPLSSAGTTLDVVEVGSGAPDV